MYTYVCIHIHTHIHKYTQTCMQYYVLRPDGIPLRLVTTVLKVTLLPVMSSYVASCLIVNHVTTVTALSKL